MTDSSIEDSLPFPLETDLEWSVAADSAWRAGLRYGRPRPGHPEGQVVRHIAEVLANIDRLHRGSPLREKLRLIALVHDTFKYQVDPRRPRTGENHHAALARRFAERYIADPAVLEVIELHDAAYNAWQRGHRDGNWRRAVEWAEALLERLGGSLNLYQEGCVHQPAAIAFEIEISMPHYAAAVLRLATSGGFYGDLDGVRRHLAAMRATAEGHAELFLEGLSLRVAVRHRGARTGTVVEGTFSTLPSEVPFPPDEGRLLSRNGPDPAFQLNFAFFTSLIDPPFVDQFIEQIDALRAHLRLFAPD